MKKIINLSRIPVILLWIALLLIPTSCKKEIKEDPFSSANTQTIKISGEDAGATTKTTLSGLVTWWVATTDKVGVYSPQARLTAEGVAIVTNAEYTASTNTAISNFTGTMYWGTGTHSFYAYYPFKSGSAAATVVPISLAPAQTQTSSSSHIGTYDFMVATPLTAESLGAGTSTTVNFHYNHVFTILEFNILSDNAEVITEVKLTAPIGRTIAFSGGTIDITQPTPLAGAPYTIAGTGSSNEITLTITPGVTLTNSISTTPSIYMMILPGDLSADNISISIKANGTDRVLTKTGKNFLRGKKYKSVMTTDIDGNVYSTVTSAGKTWLDRNLGATRVATGSTDYLAYGDLYQWGRAADGHQVIGWTSSTAGTPSQTTTATLSTTNTPVNSLFITNSSSPYDWRSAQTDNLWQGVSGTNNPCPSGFRIPTEAEFTAEMATWSPQTSVGAFGSPLKFTVAGTRYYFGSLLDVGSNGYYWSSTIGGTLSRNMGFSSIGASMGNNGRASGFSVRCIKN